ncbi:MAG: hypothetical protein HWD59_14185 [Coxiellaceae bacterium]|nr:MAG: hypothetical protein HWD59_14185 [Coxiellaceae bacterium]
MKLLASYKYPISMKISIKVMNVHDVFELLNNPSCHISELILGDSDVNQTGLIEKLGQYIKSTACKLDSLDCLGLGYVSSKGNKILLKALENNKTINKLHLKNAPSSALVSLLEVNISLREISGSVLPEAVKIALARNRKIKESGVLKSLSKLAVDKRNKNDGMANVVRAIDALWRETGFNIYSVLNCNYPFLADAFFETDNMLGLWFILISDDGDKDPYIIWNF